MPQPRTLARRIAQTKPCSQCQGKQDWLEDEERGGVKRCVCLRGRLLHIADQRRRGKQMSEEEMELK